MSKTLNFPPTEEEIAWSMIRKGLDEQGEWIYATNRERMGEMKTAYELLVSLFAEDETASIECKLSDELKSIGEITILCDEANIGSSRMADFIKAISLANNICIYPAKGNRIQCGLSFNDILDIKSK